MDREGVRIAHVDQIAAEAEEPGDERRWKPVRATLGIDAFGEFTLDGERVDAPAGTLVYLADPATVRSAVAREDDTAVLAVGGPAGRPFAVSGWEADWAASREPTG